MNAIQIELSDTLAAEIDVNVNAGWFPGTRLLVEQAETDLTEWR
jgi:hypothetical protein